MARYRIVSSQRNDLTTKNLFIRAHSEIFDIILLVLFRSVMRSVSQNDVGLSFQ
jgi:hypothetical protein